MTTIVRTPACSFLVRAAACIVVLSALGCAPAIQRQPDWLLLGEQERGKGWGLPLAIGGPLDQRFGFSNFRFRVRDKDELVVQFLPGGRIAYVRGKGEIINLSTREKVVLPLLP